jgi:hypothetical protein
MPVVQPLATAKAFRSLSDKNGMTIGSASIQGIQNAESLLNATAIKVANQNQSTGPVSDQVSLSEDAVALLQAKNDTAANVNAFRVASDLQKTLLNILA